MISYFAGIFYLVRLFVYYKDTDAFDKNKKSVLREQYVFMMRRLWNIITVPAGVIMLVTGLSMIFMNSGLMKMPWFHLKLTFLLLLGGYHFWCWTMVKKFKALDGKAINLKNISLRQANEIATFILFLVVFTVILKQLAVVHGLYLLGSFVLLVILITATVKIVNKSKSADEA